MIQKKPINLNEIRDSYVRKDDVKGFKNEILDLLESFKERIYSIEQTVEDFSEHTNNIKKELYEDISEIAEGLKNSINKIESQVGESNQDIENLRNFSDESIRNLLNKINLPVQRSVSIPVPIDQGGTGSTTLLSAQKVLDGTRSISFVLDTPTSSDVFPICQMPYDCTITKVWGTVLGGTSLTFNVEERTATTLNSSGTDVMTSDLVADADGASTTILSNSDIAANAFLVLAASAISGTVNQIVIEIDYTRA